MFSGLQIARYNTEQLAFYISLLEVTVNNIVGVEILYP